MLRLFALRSVCTNCAALKPHFSPYEKHRGVFCNGFYYVAKMDEGAANRSVGDRNHIPVSVSVLYSRSNVLHFPSTSTGYRTSYPSEMLSTGR